MTPMRLRPMRWWDVEAVQALDAELFGATAWTPAAFWSELAAGPTRWYVVAEEGADSSGAAGVPGAGNPLAGHLAGRLRRAARPRARGRRPDDRGRPVRAGQGRRNAVAAGVDRPGRAQRGEEPAARGARRQCRRHRPVRARGLRAHLGAPSLLPAGRRGRLDHAAPSAAGTGNSGTRTGPRMADDPLVLGIETSCDETGIGLVRGERLLADAVASSRRGARPVRRRRPRGRQPRAPGGDGPDDRAGLRAGGRPARRRGRRRGDRRTWAGRRADRRRRRREGARRRSRQCRCYGVNHLAAHVAVDVLEHGPLPEPTMALLVSGGHSSLLLVPDVTADVRPLGRTIDDAAGEAFDKVARLLGLPFPGGPHIDRQAGDGRRRRDRVPARALRPPRPGTAPVRLLVLRAEDGGGALGRAPRGGRPGGAGGRRRGVASRRRWSTC